MFDRQLRQLTDRPLNRVADVVHRWGVRADSLTASGLVIGLAAAAAAGVGWWLVSLGLWLGSRLLDGLDGAVARRSKPSRRGGFHDLMADFTVYAAFVVGVAVQRPEARLAAVVALASYYLSATAFLLWSSLIPESATPNSAAGLRLYDNRTVRFLGGLAEGFETIVAYALLCVFPSRAATILWVFAAMVLLTATQRVWFTSAALGSGNTSEPDRDRKHL